MVYEMRVKVHSWLLSVGGNEKRERERKLRTGSQSVRHKKQLRKSETKRKKEAKRSINKIQKNNNNYNNKNNNLITNVACAFHQLPLPIFVAVSFCYAKSSASR